MVQKLYPEEKFKAGTKRNDGLISISEKAMNETILYQEGYVLIDLDTQRVKFCVWFIKDVDEYKAECVEYDEEENLTPAENNPLDMDFQYFLPNFALEDNSCMNYLYDGFVFSAIEA